MTHRNYIGPLDVHGECWKLLPWIANESASANELARIEQHLHDCKQCQEELEFQRQLRNAIRAEEAVVLAPQTSLQKLMQRIDSAEDEQTDGPAPPQAVARAATPRAPRWLAIAAAVQGVVITALLTALWWQQSRDTMTESRFTTLTTQTVAARGAVIRVVFAGDTALDEVNQVLHSIDAQVVAGPSEAGVYTLRLTGDSAQESKVRNAITRLRADNRVMFAEPAVAAASP
jgi:hypothetical protein